MTWDRHKIEQGHSLALHEFCSHTGGTHTAPTSPASPSHTKRNHSHHFSNFMAHPSCKAHSHPNISRSFLWCLTCSFLAHSDSSSLFPSMRPAACKIQFRGTLQSFLHCQGPCQGYTSQHPQYPLYWSPAVFSHRRECHTSPHWGVLSTCSFEEAALHSLPIAPGSDVKILSQGWAREQTTRAFLFPLSPIILRLFL